MLLRRYGRSIGLEPGFTILDRGDAEDLIALVRSQLGLNEKDKRFPRKGTIAEMFSKSENTLRTSRRHRGRGIQSFCRSSGGARASFRRDIRQRSASGNWWTTTICWCCCGSLLMQDAASQAGDFATVSLHLGGRISGYESIAGGCDQKFGGHSSERDGRRRRQPVDLCLPRRDVQEHHGVSDALPRRHDL